VSTRQPRQNVGIIRSSDHIAALDGVRGVAILLVLLFHFGLFGHGLPPATAQIDKMFHALFQVGWVGVDLFFVLSGFLITGILCDSKDEAGYFRNFYIRRCLRIFPLYYATLVIFLVCLPRLVPFDDGIQYVTRHSLWYWSYLTNVLVAWQGWYVSGVLDHLWSLAVEEQFYLVWPFVVLICSRRQLWQVCVAAIVGGLVARIVLRLLGYEIAASVLAPARMDALAVGAAIALIARQPEGLFRAASIASKVMALSGVGLTLTFVLSEDLRQNAVAASIAYTLLAALFGSFLVTALTSSPSTYLRRGLTSPVLLFLGKYSYALYVFHYPLLFVRPSWLSPQAVPTILGSQLPGLFLYITGATLVSVGLAFASWHLYEKQFLKLKRFFSYRTDCLASERATISGWSTPAVAHAAANTAGSTSIVDGKR
jgi:peptidoglycan/LPS O-acetylase OafA/YrhL